MSKAEELAERSPAEAWEGLVKRWDAAYTSYRTALEAKSLLGNDEEAARECNAAETAARSELEEIRRQMDAMIGKGRNRRLPTDDEITMRILPQDTAGGEGPGSERRKIRG
jgi:hypothetical protein